MKKRVLTDVIKKILLSIFIFILLIPLSLADGFVTFLDKDYLKPLEIGEQIALIEYENGIETLTIGINFDPMKLRSLEGENTSLVWIFPIPANPEDIKINITKRRFSLLLTGHEIKEFGRNRIKEISMIFMGSQLYTLPFIYPSLVRPLYMRGVTVHERIVKEGITTEIITARDGVSIYSYIKGRGLKIDERAIPLLNMYAGKNYSFIVSWISSPERFYPFSHLLPLYERILAGEFVGVTIKFPTKKIYYPMLLTSIYGDRKIKIRIYIENFVEVDQEELNKIGKVEYYVTSSGEPAYTKIEFDAPAKYYTKDLYIDISLSTSLNILSSFLNFLTTPLSLLLTFLSLSFLAGIVTSYLLFKNYKDGLFSLFNVLSILGVFLSTLILFKNFKKSAMFTIIFSFFFLLFTFLFFITFLLI